MDGFACEKCRAIYREFQEASRRAHGRIAEHPGGLAAWLAQLSEEDCARMRESSGLWKAWRRYQQHRTLTGHALSPLPLPPGPLSNPN